MFAILLSLLYLAVPSMAQDQPQSHGIPRRWTMAQKYAAEGFKPVDCFAGQVKIRGKRLAMQPFTVFKTNAEMKCCGSVVKSGWTDRHGHFFVEPMEGGEYFAQFSYKGVQYATSFAVLQSYAQCGTEYVEIDFSELDKARVQTYFFIDDSGEPCEPAEPRCFRK